MEFLVLIVPILWTASAVWVYCDTKVHGLEKGMHRGFPDFGPYGWFFFMLFGWLVAFPLYLHKRKMLTILARQARAAGTARDPA